MAVFKRSFSPIVILAALALLPAPAWGAAAEVSAHWWFWPVVLFVVCFVLGMVSVPAGIGGGVLFVPIVNGFFPFHIDFVRAAGLMVALASALAAGPELMRAGLADLRLGLPLALLAAISALGGAMLGLAAPQSVVQIALGVAIIVIAFVMIGARKSEYPGVRRSDALGEALRLNGVLHDAALGRELPWRVHRTPEGLVMFLGIGALAGFFGLGAGWANVPVLNLVMGAPLKLSAGTSGLILSMVDSSAAWVYIHQGALLPLMAAPSVIGMMFGAFLGARLLRLLKAALIRKLVIFMLLAAGLRALTRGMGIWI